MEKKLQQLAEQYHLLEEQRIARNLAYAAEGVTFTDLKTVYIDEGVEIGKGTVIEPNVIIEGGSVIGEGSFIGSGCRIVDSKVEDKVTLWRALIIESFVGGGTVVGPFSVLHPGTQVGMGCKLAPYTVLEGLTIDDGVPKALRSKAFQHASPCPARTVKSPAINCFSFPLPPQAA